jgi:hypothetical protein
MILHLEYHRLALASVAVLALWGASLLMVRLWTRHQLIRALLRQEGESPEVRISLPDSGPADQAALEVIRSYRRRYLLSWWPGTAISFRVINDMSMELIREIARVYYPDEDRPELKASLADLVALHNRVGTRLAAWLETMPMRPFKDVELGTVMRYHEIYQNLKSHWGFAFIKQYHLDKAVRWGWTAFNYANPWHWGRKAAYHGGKEVAARLFMARITDLVGEEAMRLYGRKQVQMGNQGSGRAPAIPEAARSGLWARSSGWGKDIQ